ncbi:hypothetical protein B0H19DRAFT_321427 [Mycena capillaripes]|nr:hypothetical protein B0H19DRAFT_321427 [Mycena capillaripes]
MYWVLVSLRLACMLIAMTMNAGLILVAVRSSNSLASNDGSVGDDPLHRPIFYRRLRTPPQARDRGYAPLEETPMYFLPGCEDVGAFQRDARAKPKLDETARAGHTKRESVRPKRAPLQLGADHEESESDS